MDSKNIFYLITNGNYELASELIQTNGTLDYSQLDAFIYEKIKTRTEGDTYQKVERFIEKTSKAIQQLFFDESAKDIWQNIFGEELEIKLDGSTDWGNISRIHFTDEYTNPLNGYISISFFLNPEELKFQVLDLYERTAITKPHDFDGSYIDVVSNRMKNKATIYNKFLECGSGLIKEFLMQNQHINWLYHHYRNVIKMLTVFREKYQESYKRMLEKLRHEKFLEMISPENLPLVLGKPNKKTTTIKGEVTAVVILTVDMKKGTVESRWNKADKSIGGLYTIKTSKWRNNNIKRVYEKVKRFIKI